MRGFIENLKELDGKQNDRGMNEEKNLKDDRQGFGEFEWVGLGFMRRESWIQVHVLDVQFQQVGS